MHTHTEETQSSLTPREALDFLVSGNERFRNNLRANRNLLQQINETRDGQWPFAAVLSCIDSRTSVELIFDQGLGDLFSIRIAGNFVNEDILGSMEFACKIAGSKLIVVLGHSHCGAIKGACDSVELGNLSALIKKLEPAVEATTQPRDVAQRTSANPEFVQHVAERNVHLTIDRIRRESPLLAELEEEGAIGIVGGMYDVQSGEVAFFESESSALRE
ncbi:MAG: carbonic anhydrase [Planctomycetes bacterium]|nr:carbonic anhydrase [Planctomycetota bacterium]